MALPTAPAKGAGAKAPAPVAPGTPASGAPNAAASPSALETAARHGGLPGGKPRKDGLPPGSPQAVSADRQKDAERKRAARAVADNLRPEPAALPSAVPGATSAPVNSVGTAPGIATDPAFVPWQADILKPLIEDLLDAAEEGQVAAFLAKTKQLGDMPKLIKEIEQDAHFPKTAKVLLATSLPRLAAKYLNKSGISAEFQDEVACATAILIIVKHNREVSKKLDKIIEQTKGPKAPERKQEQTLFGDPPGKTSAADRAVESGPSKVQGPGSAPALGAPQPIATFKQ